MVFTKILSTMENCNLDQSIYSLQRKIYEKNYQQFKQQWSTKMILEKAELRREIVSKPIIKHYTRDIYYFSGPCAGQIYSITPNGCIVSGWGPPFEDCSKVIGYKEISIEYKDVLSLERRIEREAKGICFKRSRELEGLRAIEEAGKKSEKYVTSQAMVAKPHENEGCAKVDHCRLKVESVPDLLWLLFNPPPTELAKAIGFLKQLGGVKDQKEWEIPTKPAGYVLHKLSSEINILHSRGYDSLKNILDKTPIGDQLKDFIREECDNITSSLEYVSRTLPSALRPIVFSSLRTHYFQSMASVVRETLDMAKADFNYFYNRELCLIFENEVWKDSFYRFPEKTQKIIKENASIGARRQVNSLIDSKIRSYSKTAYGLDIVDSLPSK